MLQVKDEGPYLPNADPGHIGGETLGPQKTLKI
ncbi:unnamed protein product, partial [marine sediment metagenome]